MRKVKVRSATERIDDGVAPSRGGGLAAGVGPAMEISASLSSSSSDRSREAEFPTWEKLGAVVRLSYGIGIYPSRLEKKRD